MSTKGTIHLLKDEANILEKEILVATSGIRVAQEITRKLQKEIFDIRARRGALMVAINLLSVRVEGKNIEYLKED